MPTDLLPPKLDKLRKRAARARARELEARAEAEELERRLQKRAAKLGVELPPASPSPVAPAASAAPGPVVGVQAIRLLIAEDPSRIWSAAEFQACLEERSWVSESAQHRRRGIEAAISRLVRGGELRRVARGRYTVDGEPMTTPPEPSV